MIKVKILFPILALSACAANHPTLDSWSRVGDANWIATNKTATSTNESGTGFLVSTSRFDNFELTVDFRPDVKVNSGILVRCEDPFTIKPTNCYEINIWDSHPNQDYRTGAIVIHSNPPYEHLDSVDRWNQYRIVAQGKEIKVWLNDQLTATMTNADVRTGHIALQSAGGAIQFRNLSIKTIPKQTIQP